MFPAADASASYANYLHSCRFCLRLNDNLQPLPSLAQLPNTDIPQLFESLTSIKLDLTPGYSELWCTECEHRLRLAARTRAEFVCVARQWQQMLRNIGEKTTATSPTLKTEPTSQFIDFQLMFGNDDVDVKQEPSRVASDASGDDEDGGRSDRQDNDNDNNSNDVGSGDDDKPLAGERMKRNHEPGLSRGRTACPRPRDVQSQRRKYQPRFGKLPKGTQLTCDICDTRLSSR